jgi:prepilin-type N-terminal cleavage/methylation domain-containing protein
MKGFTLVELSIVLVIIGLIVGGVVGGHSLIKNARLNSVVGEVQEFQTAIRAFELQYDYLPGDWPDAQEYYPDWVGPADDEKDGDGNGRITGGAEGRMFF